MSISVGFTSGNKRENSTKQLSMTSSHNCNFKNGCSMLNPTLFLELNNSTFPDYTGFKIDDRYYNITDIRSVRNNLFEVSGQVDVLATYKANILNTEAYVLFDTDANSEIPDARLTTKTTPIMSLSTGPEIFPTSKTGCYILTVNGIGGTASYLMSKSELTSLLSDLVITIDDVLNNVQVPSVDSLVDFFLSFKDMADALLGNIFGCGNIAECIKACVWLPYDFSGSGGDEITLGTFHTGHYGTLVSPILDLPMVGVNIPWQFSDWRNGSPYTQVGLYIPFIGTMYYDASNLKGQVSLTIERSLNLLTGSMCVEVKTANLNSILGTYGADVGCSYPIGISNINWTSGATSVIALGAAIATGGAAAAATTQIASAAAGANAILGITNSLTPNPTTIGGLSGGAGVGLDTNIKCFTVCHNTSDTPSDMTNSLGTPSGEVKTLSSLTGYVQTMSASVDGAMTSEERAKLNSLLNSGIYIE